MAARRIICCFAALLVAAPVDLLAQGKPAVRPGDRVRLWAPRLGIEGSVGTVQALRSDTIVVDRGEFLVLAISSLTRLEVSRGQKSRAGTGGIVGFVGGAIAGAAVGIASIDSDCNWFSSPDCSSAVDEDLASFAGATVVGGLMGYGVGALIGSAIKTDRWEVVDLQSVRVSLTPLSKRGLGVSASIRF